MVVSVTQSLVSKPSQYNARILSSDWADRMYRLWTQRDTLPDARATNIVCLVRRRHCFGFRGSCGVAKGTLSLLQLPCTTALFHGLLEPIGSRTTRTPGQHPHVNRPALRCTNKTLLKTNDKQHHDELCHICMTPHTHSHAEALKPHHETSILQ
jgi:hypothetical protein